MPGTSGFSLMPRKMSGIAMIMIEASMVASSTPAVVLVSATHLYRGPSGSSALTAAVARFPIVTVFSRPVSPGLVNTRT